MRQQDETERFPSPFLAEIPSHLIHFQETEGEEEKEEKLEGAEGLLAGFLERQSREI